MTYRLDAPGSNTSRARLVLASAVVVAALVAVERYVAHAPVSPAGTAETVTPARTQPSATQAIASNAAQLPAIIRADDATLPPERLKGRWTMLFTPSEPCVDKCARVLETLSLVAHDPASGVQDGVAQIVLAKPQAGPAAREIVVLDPDGRSAGQISYITDAGRIVSGLATLRAAYVAGNTTASR
ncbi:MAG TPA: hypothetical protein VFP44_07075 [Usitatibacter sp.]|nr:hypothetical protein [Usitatibacter sp.]